jgi:DNA-binding NarL/FixJ family response regulator
MTTVLLVDDHRLVLAGLVTLVSAAADLEVVGTASTGGDAVALAARTSPDVVVMDLSMPGGGGVEATRQIARGGTSEVGPQVLVLSSSSDRDSVVQAVQAGAAGYLLKDSDPADLVHGIRATARGESPLDPRVARILLSGGGAREPAARLTERERSVLRLVADGLANKQIARRLGISESTVKTHLTHAFGQIGVRDRTSAALWVRSNLAPTVC